MHYLLYLLLPSNILIEQLHGFQSIRLKNDGKKLGISGGHDPAFYFIAGVHLSKTGQLTLEAGKCAQSDESLIPSFYIITIEAVYGQVFVFLNLQCVNFASSIPFIMCYLYCVASTKSTKPRLHVPIRVLSCWTL